MQHFLFCSVPFHFIFRHTHCKQNDKNCFRQFVAGFVEIWTEQLNLDFEHPTLWNEISQSDGPHLKRLPDELLPAIGKFLIVAKDSYQNDAPLNDDELTETTLLLKCLTMICRHFDNIQTVANYQYISCAVTISMNIIMVVSQIDSVNMETCLPNIYLRINQYFSSSFFIAFI